MKKAVLIGLFVILLASFVYGNGATEIGCSVKQSCTTRENAILYLNQQNNAHGYTNYIADGVTLCCEIFKGTTTNKLNTRGIKIGTECQTGIPLLWLNQENNAHAYTREIDGYYPICVRGVECQNVTGGTSPGADFEFVIGLNQQNNAHLYSSGYNGEGAVDIVCKLSSTSDAGSSGSDTADDDSAATDAPTEACTNLLDDDADGLTDCLDEDCDGEINAAFGEQNCLLTEGCTCNYEEEIVCNDGFDNDQDYTCTRNSDCPAGLKCSGSLHTCSLEDNCDDGMDNDDDGKIDCADSNCRNDISCQEEGIMLKVSSNCFLSLTDDEYEVLMEFYDDDKLTSAQKELVGNCLTGSPSGGAIIGLAVADTITTEPEAEPTAIEAAAETITETVTEPVTESPSFFSRLWTKIKNIFSRERPLAGQAYTGPAIAGIDCTDSDCVGEAGPHGICCLSNTDCTLLEYCTIENECTLCNEEDKYQIKLNREELCNGQRWITCSDFNANPLYDPKVEVNCLDNQFTTTELSCTDGFDNDKDNKVDFIDEDCGGGQSFDINKNANFEVTIKSTDLKKIKVVAEKEVRALWVCDPNLVADEVQICYKAPRDDTFVSREPIISSLTKLNNENEKPFHPLEIGLVYLYQRPLAGAAKEVSLILPLDLTSAQELPFFQFASNILAGQRLVLILNGQYYLLELPPTDRYLTEELTLTHLPTLEPYTPQLYHGTDQYLFTVMGGDQIVLNQVGRNMVISTLEPGEVPAAYVVDQNLAENYEINFDFAHPVNIIAPALGELTICQNDEEVDWDTVKICHNDEDFTTLRVDQLTRVRINSNDYGMLFEMVENEAGENTKTISIFQLIKLGEHDLENKFNLDYHRFTTKMAAGKRVVFQFKNNLYLAEHSANNIDITTITLNAYTDTGVTPIEAVGSKSLVEFSTLDGGKIYLKKNFGDPIPPYDLWALEQHELAPVDLEYQLFTSFSSFGAININNPNLGTIKVRDSDNPLDQAYFEISASTAAKTRLNLAYQEPLVNSEQVLFYYHTASFTGTTPVKTASVYLFYNLSDSAPDTHDYNAEFIKTLTDGKELVLGFEDSYYLLGHQNVPEQPAFFDINKLVLKTLDGMETFNSTPLESNKVGFTVPEGQIYVRTENLQNKIYFSKSTKSTLETEEFTGEKYSVVLTTTSRVEINGIYLELCNVELYRYVTAADVCVYTTDEVRDKQILVDKPVVEKVSAINYLFEPNGLTGDEKEITVRKLISFSHPDFGNWDDFIAKIVSGDVPVIKARSQLYLPVAVDNLLTNFALRSYFAGTVYSLKNGQPLGPVTYNGTFTLNDSVVFAEQSLLGDRDARYISTEFKVKDYSYVPDSHDKLLVKKVDAAVPPLSYSPLNFITSPSGKIYTLSVTEILPKLLKLKLNDDKNMIIFERYFADNDQRIISLDNVNTIIEVEGIGDANANVTVRR